MLGKLIQRAAQKDQTAFDDIVSRFGDLIRAECMKFNASQNPEWSHSDSYQEVWMHVYDSLHQFRSFDHEDVDNIFRGWLRRTARNVLSNLYRDQNAVKRRPPGGKVASLNEDLAILLGNNFQSEETPSAFLARCEQLEALRDAIKTLPVECQEILQRKFNKGQNLKKIAAAMDLTYDQVRNRFHQSIERLSRVTGLSG